MTNFFNTRIHRTSATAMLLVWILTLILGVANACMLEAPGAATHANTTINSVQNDVKHTSSAGHSQIQTSSVETDDGHASKQPCLKFCDDSSRSLSKKYPAGQIDPGLPSVVAVLWSLAEPVFLHYKQPKDTQRVVSKVPLRHRYARLAL